MSINFFYKTESFKRVDHYTAEFGDLNADKQAKMEADAVKYGNIAVISKAAYQWIRDHRKEIDVDKANELLKTLRMVKLGDEAFANANWVRRIACAIFSLIRGPHRAWVACEQFLQKIAFEENILKDIKESDHDDLKMFGKDGQLDRIAMVIDQRSQKSEDITELQKCLAALTAARAGEEEHRQRSLPYRVSTWVRNPAQQYDTVYQSVETRLKDLQDNS